MAKILIIDDEEHIRRLLRNMLEREGHVIVDTPNGEEGMRIYREEPADLIITDLFMPGKDGLGTIVALREDTPDAKIIVISGGGRTRNLDVLSAAKALGALCTIAKPFTREEILDAVRNALDL